MKDKSNRRWYQFSLRGLFIAITLVSLTLGFLFVLPAQRQRMAVDRIVRLGGGVQYSSGTNQESWSVLQLRRCLPRDFFDTVVAVNLYSTPATDADLWSLSALAEIEQIDLIGTPVTDSGLAHLQNLKHLRDLALDGTRITGAGLAHLHQLTQLKDLSLTKTRVSDASVTELQKSLPGCRIIR